MQQQTASIASLRGAITGPAQHVPKIDSLSTETRMHTAHCNYHARMMQLLLLVVASAMSRASCAADGSSTGTSPRSGSGIQTQGSFALPAHRTIEALLPAMQLAGENHNDTYLCSSVALPQETLHITAFNAVAPSKSLSSLVIYGAL